MIREDEEEEGSRWKYVRGEAEIVSSARAKCHEEEEVGLIEGL